MAYPGSLDNIPNVTSGQLIASAYENSQTNAINAIESTLGINPQGSYPSVSALLAANNYAASLYLVSNFT